MKYETCTSRNHSSVSKLTENDLTTVSVILKRPCTLIDLPHRCFHYPAWLDLLSGPRPPPSAVSSFVEVFLTRLSRMISEPIGCRMMTIKPLGSAEKCFWGFCCSQWISRWWKSGSRLRHKNRAVNNISPKFYMQLMGYKIDCFQPMHFTSICHG